MNIINIKGIDCYEQDGTAYLNLEAVAKGLGFVKIDRKDGAEYERVNRQFLKNQLFIFGILDSEDDKLPDYIPENIFYRLAMKAKNETAEKFQALIADEVIPQIRKTGAYMTPKAIYDFINNPKEFLDKTVREKPKEEREKIQQMRSEAMLLNARSRQADLWNKFADKLDSKEHKQICASYGTEVLAGHRVIPLPEVDKSYSASEVGKLLGISANAVGRIANQNGLKTKEYGYYALDKSAHSNKEVEVFRYNERGVAAVKSHM